ncbi:MAG: hypothetical protein L0I62_03665 [Gammaproteobacteria bacterium]|nr:hypothetical protein [Gammaproteobacteria bacterium]
MLHPSEFQVNEVWIVFALNDAPIQTEQDGAFDCICLMDAASCFILANEMTSSTAEEPSQLEARHLFEMALAHKHQTPSTLFVPTGQFQNVVTAEAQRRGIEVVSVTERELLAFIGEAKQGFREHVLNGSRE